FLGRASKRQIFHGRSDIPIIYAKLNNIKQNMTSAAFCPFQYRTFECLHLQMQFFLSGRRKG
ncbi:hypothetical protein L6R21_23140, partial [bacterium]|nr:hypothetical protein [bacterium]